MWRGRRHSDRGPLFQARMIDFVGCKAAFFCGDSVLTCLRDDKPGLFWPAQWDLPGGGRENGEPPKTCLLREREKEFGLALPSDRLLWRCDVPALIDATRRSHFFAGRISAAGISALRFGEAGQFWQMMALSTFLIHPLGIPAVQDRTAQAWAALV